MARTHGWPPMSPGASIKRYKHHAPLMENTMENSAFWIPPVVFGISGSLFLLALNGADMANLWLVTALVACSAGLGGWAAQKNADIVKMENEDVQS